jgi:hypothetical protein
MSVGGRVVAALLCLWPCAAAAQSAAGAVPPPGAGAPPPAAGVQAPAAPAEVLVERTLAIVGGAVITLSDALLAETLRLVDTAPAAGADTVARLVDRWLMLHEVARFAPAEPDAAAVSRRLAGLASGLGGEAALAAALTRAGLDADDLELWVRDDLRIAAYLDQRFTAAVTVADADVTAWIQANAAELARLGASGAEAVRVARERLQRGRRADLIADWLADLRRRIDVQVFPR